MPAFGPIPAIFMLVGEAPGADEERIGKPFVGKSGWCLDAMLGDAGIARSACFVTNVCKYRPPGNKLESKTHAWWTDKKSKAAKMGCPHFRDDMYYNDLIAAGLAELEAEILRTRPQVIIGLGNLPLWALTGHLGISQWHGSELWLARLNDETSKAPPPPVIPTYHPAYVLRMWEWRATVVHDLRKRVTGKLTRPNSRQMPKYNFVVPSTAQYAVEALRSWGDRADAGWMDVTCDVETRHGRIACVGFGFSELDAICIPLMHVDGTRYWTADDEKYLCAEIQTFMRHHHVRLIGQNFNYDRQYFIRDPLFGFRPSLYYDTMIGQHLLFPGTPKDLAHQSSMYCAWHCYWKDEGKEIETEDEPQWWQYNCRDCVTTWEIAATTRPLLAKAGFLEVDK